MKHRILVINPGSTSTKIAVFEGKEKLFDTTLRYSTEELTSFGWVMEQVDFRRATIEKALADNNIDPDSLDAICARGGQVPYCAAGTYRVGQAMVDFMYTRRQGAHASNLGCVLALLLAKPLGIPAYIVDPVMVDEMDDVARVSGLPELPRKMQGHALNCRAMAIRCADEVLHKPLADCRLIVLHLGGGGSCRLFVDGRMVDCVRDDEWMFAPERFGGAAMQDVVTLCYSGKYTESEMMGFVRGKGGLVAHLGTSNAIEVEKRIEEGDSHAKLVYDGMLYSNVRAIGALAAAADGKIDPTQIYHTFPDRREGSKSSLILKRTKTKKSNRILYMTKPLKEELLAWLEKMKQDEQNAPEKYSNCGQLFRLPDGLPIAPDVLTKWYRQWRAEHPEFEKIVFHGLRHSSATYQLLQSGGDFKSVQGNTGHATATVLMDTYAHTQDKPRLELTEKIEADFYTQDVAGAKPQEPPENKTPVATKITGKMILEAIRQMDAEERRELTRVLFA